MATNYLDTGDTGRAVSAESDGALFAGIFGSAKYVLENGSQLKAEVQSNNIVKISDGDAVMYGRHVRIPANDSALVTINNGHSGTNRIDLIVFRYTKDSTGKETVDLVVIQGEDSTGTATAPTAVDGNILTGAMQSDFPLYSVELNGINIVKVNPLFNVIGNISKLKEELTELNSNLTKANNILTNMESNLMAINTYHMTLNTSNVKTPDSWIECNRIGNLVMINGCAKITKAVNTYSVLNIASGAPVPCCNKQLYTVAIAQDNNYSNCFLEVSKSGAVNLLVRWQKASSGDIFYYEFCYICK